MKRGWTRFLCGLTALCFALALLPGKAKAAETGKAIQLISSENPSGGIEKGHHVYFGTKASGYTWTDPQPYWRVLDAAKTNTGAAGMFLLSENLIGNDPGGSNGNILFDNTERYLNEWQGSEAQGWCSAFLTRAFSGTEQGAILSVSKSDAEESLYGLHWGESSLSGEQVFFLSAREVNDYISPNEGNDFIANYGSSAGWWWLRSHFAYCTDYAGLVCGNGYVYKSYVNLDNAARPAFNLNLSSVLFTSAAEGGKASGSGVSALTAVSSYTGTDWKLTLKDSSRSGFSASATGRTGSEWTIEYSGAKTGDSEYVSAVVKDSSGNVTYYGRIEKAKSGTNTCTLDVGSKLNGGTLYVFNEQYNGEKKTDFASELVQIDEPEEEPDPTKASYSVTKGAGATWEKGCGKPMEYVVTRTPDNEKAYGLFQKLLRNGSDVPVSSYTASSGSLKLSLNASYLETLSKGAHTLRFQFEDGYAETRLTIKAPANAPKEVPKTGDTNRHGLWALMGSVALIGACIAARGLKRMKRE